MKYLWILFCFFAAGAGFGADKQEAQSSNAERQALLREEIDARLMLRRHEKQEVALTEEEIARYRSIVASARARRAAEKRESGGANRDNFVVSGLSLQLLAPLAQKAFEKPVEVAESIQDRQVSFRFRADTPAEARAQLAQALLKSGVQVVVLDDRVRLEPAAAVNEPKANEAR